VRRVNWRPFDPAPEVLTTLKKALTTAALLGSLLAVSSVWAHAHLKKQTPAADSTVSAPAELRLEFSEGVEAAFTKVMISKDGIAVPVKSLATECSDKKTLIVTPAKPLTAGAYKVEWHVVSVDTHKSEGANAFNHPEQARSLRICWTCASAHKVIK